MQFCDVDCALMVRANCVSRFDYIMSLSSNDGCGSVSAMICRFTSLFQSWFVWFVDGFCRYACVTQCTTWWGVGEANKISKMWFLFVSLCNDVGAHCWTRRSATHCGLLHELDQTVLAVDVRACRVVSCISTDTWSMAAQTKEGWLVANFLKCLRLDEFSRVSPAVSELDILASCSHQWMLYYSHVLCFVRKQRWW